MGVICCKFQAELNDDIPNRKLNHNQVHNLRNTKYSTHTLENEHFIDQFRGTMQTQSMDMSTENFIQSKYVSSVIQEEKIPDTEKYDIDLSESEKLSDDYNREMYLEIIIASGITDLFEEVSDIINNNKYEAKYLNFIKIYFDANTENSLPSEFSEMFKDKWFTIAHEIKDGETPIDTAKKLCEEKFGIKIEDFSYKGKVKKEYKQSYYAEVAYYFVVGTNIEINQNFTKNIVKGEKEIWETVMSDTNSIINYNMDYENINSETFKVSLTKQTITKDDCESSKKVSDNKDQLKNKPKKAIINEKYNKEKNLEYNFELTEYYQKPYRMHETRTQHTMDHTIRDYIMFLQHQNWETRQLTETNLESFEILNYFEKDGIYYCFMHIITKDIMKIISGKELYMVKAIKKLENGQIIEVFKSFVHPKFERNPKKSWLTMMKAGNIYNEYKDENDNFRVRQRGYQFMDPKLKLGIN